MDDGSVTPVSFGCAYFGVRDPDHAHTDLAAMARAGFGWVLLPFTQDDAAWEVSTFRALVAIAESHALEPVISPWGGDEFGGEGVQTSMATMDWVERAKATGAPILHIDEPKLSHVTIPEILDRWGDDRTVWLTVEPHRAAIVDPTAVASVAVLGTDAYGGTIDDRVARTRAFHAHTGRLDLAWVEAFRIPAGGEGLVGDGVRAMAGLAPRVGVWGWKGSTGRGELRSADPVAVQAAVDGAIAELRAAAGIEDLPRIIATRAASSARAIRVDSEPPRSLRS